MSTPAPATRVEFSLPLTREEAERIIALGREATIFVMLELGARVASEQTSAASTPSGMLPPYKKPPTPKRRKKPGAKPGHPGHCREEPEATHTHTHSPLTSCPKCGTAVGAVTERRFRLIEDIPETQPEVTWRSIPRHWCPQCKKLVEPPVADAMPSAKFGHRFVALTAWLHYGVGVTISQVLAVLVQTESGRPDRYVAAAGRRAVRLVHRDRRAGQDRHRRPHRGMGSLLEETQAAT